MRAYLSSVLVHASQPRSCVPLANARVCVAEVSTLYVPRSRVCIPEVRVAMPACVVVLYRRTRCADLRVKYMTHY